MITLNIHSVNNSPLCKVNVPITGTVADVKKELEKVNRKFYIDRQSFRVDVKGKDIDNNKSLKKLGLRHDATVYIKDLGPQIGWRTVYIAEYIGPLVLYGLFACRPSVLYNYREVKMSLAAKIAMICWMIHYSKRVYESAYIHRFSRNTMPIRNLFKNCLYYWGFAAYIASHINHPHFTPPSGYHLIIGTAIFSISEIANLSVHLLLRDLRPEGTAVRQIPMPNRNYFTRLYNYVSCPNYTYEIAAWIGFFLITHCLPVLLFTLVGAYQMTIWALARHKAYKKEFANYPNRKAIFPYVM